MDGPNSIAPKIESGFAIKRTRKAFYTLAASNKILFHGLCQYFGERKSFWQKICRWAGSPGLVVMGRDSFSKGCGFKSLHHIMDGHFFAYICCKNCNVCLEKPKINKKEAEVGPKKTFVGGATKIMKIFSPNRSSQFGISQKRPFFHNNLLFGQVPRLAALLTLTLKLWTKIRALSGNV